jgi:hypothetical protein
MYDWGVSFGGVASREAESDVLQVDVPVETLPTVQEQFLVSFDETVPAMVLAWDMTKVSILK